MRTPAFVLLALVSSATAGCVSPAPPRAAAPSRPATGTVAGLVEAHNRERGRAGLAPLAVNPRLTAAAQAHADDMAARRRMSHRGSDVSSPFQRMAREGYPFRSAGENVAYGQPTVEGVMADWMRSRGHRRNILGRFAEIGAAYATDERGTPYWCVTFGTPAAG